MTQPKPRASFLFGLAPCGVCPARDIAAAAVRSYRTFSPLPRRRGEYFYVAHILMVTGGQECPRQPKPLTTAARRYVFCGTFRRMTLKSSSRTLSGTPLCGVRTFLPRHLTPRERPSGPAAYCLIIVEHHRLLVPVLPSRSRDCRDADSTLSTRLLANPSNRDLT